MSLTEKIINMPWTNVRPRNRQGINSIFAAPIRGNFGKNYYPGNHSGNFQKPILEYYKTTQLIDPMEGSGTSKDVAKRLGIPYMGFDLKSGFNFLKDQLPLLKRGSGIWAHYAYWDIYKYSEEVWGNSAIEGDLSAIRNYWDYIKALSEANYIFMDALPPGGLLFILLADVKKQGELYPIQADMNRYGKPEMTIIKPQFNVQSDKREYKYEFIPLAHEYLIILRKPEIYYTPSREVGYRMVDLRQKMTWSRAIWAALWALGGKATVKELVAEIERSFPEKLKTNPTYKDTIRRELNQRTVFKKVEKSTWALAS